MLIKYNYNQSHTSKHLHIIGNITVHIRIHPQPLTHLQTHVKVLFILREEKKKPENLLQATVILRNRLQQIFRVFFFFP